MAFVHLCEVWWLNGDYVCCIHRCGVWIEHWDSHSPPSVHTCIDASFFLLLRRLLTGTTCLNPSSTWTSELTLPFPHQMASFKTQAWDHHRSSMSSRPWRPHFPPIAPPHLLWSINNSRPNLTSTVWQWGRYKTLWKTLKSPTRFTRNSGHWLAVAVAVPSSQLHLILVLGTPGLLVAL